MRCIAEKSVPYCQFSIETPGQMPSEQDSLIHSTNTLIRGYISLLLEINSLLNSLGNSLVRYCICVAIFGVFQQKVLIFAIFP